VKAAPMPKDLPEHHGQPGHCDGLITAAKKAGLNHYFTERIDHSCL